MSSDRDSDPGYRYLNGSWSDSSSSGESYQDDLQYQDTVNIGAASGTVNEQLRYMGSGLLERDDATDDPQILEPAVLPEPSSGRMVLTIPIIEDHVLRRARANDVISGWAYTEDKSERSVVSSRPPWTASPGTSIIEQLVSSRRLDTMQNKLFYPRSVFESDMMKMFVQQELEKVFPAEKVADMVHRICTKTLIHREHRQTKIRWSRRLFLILVLIGMTSAIESFLDSGMNDTDLPLKLVGREHSIMNFNLSTFSSPGKPEKVIEFTRMWDTRKVEAFEESQWTTLVPYFTRRKTPKKVWHHRLNRSVICPFVGTEEKGFSSGGGSARIFKVRIDDGHHGFHKQKNYTDFFALKRLNCHDRESFENEVDVLRRFSQDKHQHLISLLFTFEHCDRFYLLFDWAQCNLKEYWREIDRQPSATDTETVDWVGKQCLGIASGILELHKYRTTSRLSGKEEPIYGYHGDIKEENILWFPGITGSKNTGVLKLADFGVAGLRAYDTVSVVTGAYFTGTPSYRPPESDLRRPRAPGPSYDMWTLGILYMQICTWLLGGSSLLDQFKERRSDDDPSGLFSDIKTDTFFTIRPKNNETIIKPVVTQFFQELHSHASCTQFLHSFLDLIEKEVLIVQSSRPEGRIQAMKLYPALKKLVLAGGKETDDTCKAVPRSTSSVS